MNLLETLGQTIYLAVFWIVTIVWLILCWILKLKRGSLKFLYWDFVFAILLTLTFMTSVSFFAVGIEYKKIWLLIPAVGYGLFDLAENTVLIFKFPEKTSLALFFTAGKWLFYSISNLFLIILMVIYFLK